MALGSGAGSLGEDAQFCCLTPGGGIPHPDPPQQTLPCILRFLVGGGGMMSPPSTVPGGRGGAVAAFIRMKDGMGGSGACWTLEKGVWVTILIWKVVVIATAVQVEKQAKKM